MFEFLFKRPGDKPADSPAGQTAPADGGKPASPTAAAREQQAQQVAGLRGDEAGAADFILQCDFSELRLAAAEFVHSRAQLERVHAGVRNTDRRVAKLMQARLDAIRHHEAELERGQACIAQAETLLRDERLTPNLVADLDHAWAVIKAPELASQFEALRAQLGQRLEAQVVLQRAMIDRLGQIRALAGSALPAADIAAQLRQIDQEQQQALAAPEHSSLPRSLTNEVANEMTRVSASLADLELGQAAIARRDALLAEWQGVAPESLNADLLNKAWRQLPPVPEPAAAQLRQRFDELLATLPATVDKPAAPKSRSHASAQAPDQSFLDKVDAMEAALQHGSLGAAAELDKELKDSKGVRLAPALAERLAHARAELKRLSDWARWGGNVSREELIKAVEQLSTQSLAMSELAKKVGSMRERWKALDTLSGAAPKSLWERFDAACSAAYAPAAAHFKHLAEERHANAAKAEVLIAQAVAEGATLGEGAVDWKQMATKVQGLRLAWSHLGAIDRKDKKRLDQAFTDALNVLQAPLEQQRKGEVSVREDLIAKVAALNPGDRHTLDTLKSLQEQWQEHARALPLERKSEQALWQRFRAACDAVFAKRKESAHAADAERRAHQHAKEALCERLEQAAAAADASSAGKLLREAAAEWHAIGPVPRANEARVDKRYQSAVAALQHHLDTAKRDASRAQATALRDKLHLCRTLEAQLADASADPAATDWNGRWAALPAVGSDYDKALHARLLAGQTAITGDRQAYAAKLESNRAALMHEVLRLEIGAGIDSGSEFARERLKLQVETLQSSLKSGQKPAGAATQFLHLCALPALADQRTTSRIEHLFARVTKDGK
ncbi:DUF349 domain-containing protein [Massilia sp. CF038]|uniref:DUF349 domain-containing protein n=1 Tax=Massilia sp. CF038 TaxID=1881045 RepID=UPI00091E80A5|nr:DUF349 domain-containing protein [Massilia sp. CF038]SHG59953.1 protein of unknown function [Massilia sp. CF038]